MKARPRRIEREAASHLSVFFQSLCLPAVERIPVLGRTGPDIEINQYELVVDVKSRLSVPMGMEVRRGYVSYGQGKWIGTRLDEISLIPTTPVGQYLYVQSFVSTQRWLDHMDKWTQAEMPDGITSLILHRPGMAMKDATFLIKCEHLEKFNDRYNHYHSLYGSGN